MKNIRKIIFLSLITALTVFESCVKDLDRVPPYDLSSATVYNDPANYRAILAKAYAGLAVTGQQGPAGNPDIKNFDEGFSSYMRMYYYMQELTTDEAVIGWNDGSIKDLHHMNWTSANEFIKGMYYRIFYQITLCNELIRESSDDKLSSRGLSGNTDIKTYRTEARFLRALSYWHALDLFGNTPFVTEADPLGTFLPKQTTRADLFAYIEKELKEVETLLPDAKTAGYYGRSDKAAAWTLLAKLYLNAEVYTGASRATDCLTYCNKVIAAGYTLEPKYESLFKIGVENSKEVIFAIPFDGLRQKNWGGMTFLVHAPVGGTMRSADFGINGGWAGLRTTREFVALYKNSSGTIDANDTRAMFYTDGQTLNIDDIGDFKNGYAIAKFKNVDANGKAGSDPEGNFPDTDYPMFRLAEVHLMYAEAVLRGGTGGTTTQALKYVNDLRRRAAKDATKYTDLTTITKDDVLNERGRELVWESVRRTDLIRYGKFTTGTYLWQWKGKALNGAAVSDNFNLFPIPSSDVVANPNLKQNTGY